MSVGLGNIWRFPFTAYENGGGAFLIPYLIALLLIGRPLYLMEMLMGQFSGMANIKLWNLCPGMMGKSQTYSFFPLFSLARFEIPAKF